MLNFAMIERDPNEVLDLYFRQCSVNVTGRDLAIMAATLANDGKNPLTGEVVFDTQYVRDMLSVMNSCGMYDYAGEWAYEVGMPAKSGVSGCIIAVIPGQIGICVYSPPVDRKAQRARHPGVPGDFQEFGCTSSQSHWPAPSSAASSTAIVRSAAAHPEEGASRRGWRSGWSRSRRVLGSAERLSAARPGRRHTNTSSTCRAHEVDQAARRLLIELTTGCRPQSLAPVHALPPTAPDRPRPPRRPRRPRHTVFEHRDRRSNGAKSVDRRRHGGRDLRSSRWRAQHLRRPDART
jgi:glutaminase